MKVSSIQKAVQSFERYLDSGNKFDHFYLYEIPHRFHNSLQEEDTLLKAILFGLKSDHTQRLWQRTHYEPKKIILQLGREFPDFFNDAMKDLFNEDMLLENRIDRFKFYCNELLTLYKQKHKQSNVNHHYVDESFISCLLMGYNPETYAYYDHQLFVETAKIVGAKPIPTVNDYPRYQNFIKVFCNYINENEKLLRLHKKRLPHLHSPANLAVECMVVATGRDLLAH